MGFTPIMALIKGGAEYKNKVNLMRMQGELDLKKIRQKSASDALVDATAELADSLIDFLITIDLLSPNWSVSVE